MSSNQPEELKYFKVFRYATVKVESSVIPAHNWSEAVRAFEVEREQSQSLERRLRSMAGDHLIVRHEFEGELDGALVNQVDEDGSYINEAADLEEEDVHVVAGRRTF